MNIKERLLALAEGKKIRITTWMPHHFVHLQGNRTVDPEGRDYCPNWLLAAEVTWELYKEPADEKQEFIQKYCNEMRWGAPNVSMIAMLLWNTFKDKK